MAAEITRQIIDRRLKAMVECLNHLETFRVIELTDFLADLNTKLVVERIIEILVSLASEINIYLLINLYHINPETYREAFLEAGKQKIIDEALARELSKSAGMRNIIAHQYVDINYELLYQSINRALVQYRNFVQQIVNFLDSLEVSDG